MVRIWLRARRIKMPGNIFGDKQTLIVNCSLAGGVFTATVTDFGKQIFPSVIAGENVEIDLKGKIYTFNDDTHASSHLTNLGFGITETVDWANDMPYYIYFVNEDDTIDNVGLFISRNPALAVTPAAAAIHDKDAAAGTDDETSIFGAWSDDAGKAAKPCILIGAIRMQWSTTTDDWTIQTLSNNDGVGKDRLDKTFATTWTMPLSQMGAATGTHLLDNGGTAPVFTTNNYFYTLGKDGYCTLHINLTGDPGTDGVGAVTSQVSIPYLEAIGITNFAGMLHVDANGTTAFNITQIASSQNYFTMSETDGDLTENGDFSNGARTVAGTIRYKAF